MTGLRATLGRTLNPDGVAYEDAGRNAGTLRSDADAEHEEFLFTDIGRKVWTPDLDDDILLLNIQFFFETDIGR